MMRRLELNATALTDWKRGKSSIEKHVSKIAEVLGTTEDYLRGTESSTVLSKRLIDERKKRNISHREIADTTEIPLLNLVSYELGRMEPDIVSLNKLASFFGVSIDYLVGRTDDPHMLIFRNKDDGSSLVLSLKASSPRILHGNDGNSRRALTVESAVSELPSIPSTRTPDIDTEAYALLRSIGIFREDNTLDIDLIERLRIFMDASEALSRKRSEE